MLDVWRLHFEVAPLIGTGNQTGRYATSEDDPDFRCEAGALGEQKEWKVPSLLFCPDVWVYPLSEVS